MKIAIASGKGGVGKSMLASSLAILLSKEKKLAVLDCDVDAPNLAIWLNEIGSEKKIPVSTSSKPEIDLDKCNGCGLCESNCHFSAIKVVEGKAKVNQFLCEGCGVCEIVCPQKAVILKEVKNGEIIIKNTKYGFPLLTGKLLPGETGSGKIITELKKEAESFEKEFQVLDCSPGTACPVIASFQDVNFAVLVTEPTPSAFSDLKRVLTVARHFKIPFGLVINKADLNEGISGKIEKWAGKRLLGKISYDKEIFNAVSNFNPIMETDLLAKKEIEEIFNNLKSFLW